MSADVDRGDVREARRVEDVHFAVVGIRDEVGVRSRVEERLLRGRDDDLAWRDRRQRQLLHAFGTLGTRLSPRLLNARDGDGNHQSDRDCGADGDPAYETATEGRAATPGATGEAEHRLVDRSRGLS